jgi:hypothetical protein
MNVTIDGDVVSFELERHPGLRVVVQTWALDLVSLKADLVKEAK